MGVYKHPKVIWMYMQKSGPTFFAKKESLGVLLRLPF